jgi:PAT family beta-lactamase induction signal transducer AmpG
VVSTYFAEGLPYSIVHQISAQFFVAMGASLPTVGLTSLYGLAWNFKFVWSPLVDIYGTTKRWLWVSEAALALAVMIIAWPAQQKDLGAVASALVVVSLLAATHDIAIDGFYLRAIPSRNEQAALSGLRIPAYRIALLVGNGGLVMLAGLTSWRWCFLASGAILLVLAAGHAALLPREARPTPRPDPGDPYRARPEAEGTAARQLRYRDAFSTFLEQPRVGVTLTFILLYRAGDSLMFAMAAPLMRSLGFGTIGQGVLGGLGTSGSIAGSIFGGVVIARFGLKRALFPITLAQSLAILLYVALAVATPSIPWTLAAIVTEQIIAGMGSAALVVFLMHRCEGEYKASHFAIGTALMSVGATVFGTASGYLASYLGFPAFFTLAYAASLPGVLLARLVPKE